MKINEYPDELEIPATDTKVIGRVGLITKEIPLTQATVAAAARAGGIDTIIAAVQAEVDAEEVARATAVANEATARSSADATLQANINAETTARSTAIAAEATARENADAALAALIPPEASVADTGALTGNDAMSPQNLGAALGSGTPNLLQNSVAYADAIAKARRFVVPSGGDDSAVINAAAAALTNGGTVELSPGVFNCAADTLVLPEGVSLIGAGTKSATGSPTTRLNFSGLANTKYAIRLNAAADSLLSDFYVTGKTSGAVDEIIAFGNCRRVRIERVVVNTATTGSGINLGVSGYCIQSSVRDSVVVGAGIGFSQSASSTSIVYDACYANNCSTAGFLLSGTYCTYNACAADGNFWGYLIQTASAITLNSCGAESSTRSGFHFTAGASGIVINACRGHNNNTSASASFPSFAAINDGANNIIFTAPVDTSPVSGTAKSIRNYSGAPGSNIRIVFGDLALGVDINVPLTTDPPLSSVANTGAGTAGGYVGPANLLAALSENDGTPNALQNLSAFAAMLGSGWRFVAASGGDDTSALQSAATASKFISLQAGASYSVSGTVTLQSGASWNMNGATITQTSIRTPIFDVAAKIGIQFRHGRFVGHGADFNNSPSSQAVAFFGSGSSNVDIEGCVFTNFTNTPCLLSTCNGFRFCHNTVIGPGAPVLTASTSGACYGILVEGNSVHAIISNNFVSKCAQGIATGDNVIDVTVSNNQIFDIVGQHGAYFGAGQVGLVVTGNTIRNVSLIGIKVQMYDTPAVETIGVAIKGNTISQCGGSGIGVVSTTPAATLKARDIVIEGNTIKGTVEDGINLSHIVGLTVRSNRLSDIGRDGYAVTDCEDGEITPNVRNAQLDGARMGAGNKGLIVSGGSIYRVGLAGVASNRNGIHLSGGEGYMIASNRVEDDASNMQYGLLVEAGSHAETIIESNRVKGAYEYGARFIPGTIGRVASNVFSGTSGSTTGMPATDSLASTR